MTRTTQLQLAFTLTLITSPLSAADRCTSDQQSAAATTAQAFLDALLKTNRVPGMAAAVWQDDKVVWTGCAGWRDLETKLPVQSDTVFRLASVSKVLTTTAIAKLVEQGKLDLDKPVQTLLPWLKNDWPAITVRQLAAHASGLPHYRASDRDVGQKHYADGRAAVRIFANRPLLAPPGQSYSYSSWGYTLIGAVIEAKSGQHVLDYIGKSIVPGLDIHADGAYPARQSRLYALRNNRAQQVEPQDFSYTWSGGGFAATADGLVRFAGRLMLGEIISAQSWQLMREPFALSSGMIAGERDYQVGLGWRIGQDGDAANIAHHSGVTVGARSSLVLWPEEHAASAVLSNAEWVSSIEKTAILLAAPFRAPPTHLVHATCPTQAVKYIGDLGGRKLEGRVRFQLDQGRCLGILHADPVIREYFASASAWSDQALKIIGFSTEQDLARAALVTPFGLYDLRAESKDKFGAQLSSAQKLTLQFHVK